MLDIAKGYPKAPPQQRGSQYCHLSQWMLHPQRNLPWFQDRDCHHPLGLSSHGQMRLTYPLEDADHPMDISLDSQLDLTFLGSREWMVSHYPAKGKVHFQYQTWVITQVTLQLTLTKHSWTWIEELWTNVTFFTWPTHDYTTPRLLGSDQKCVVNSFAHMTCVKKHDEFSLIWCCPMHACLVLFCLYPPCFYQFLLVVWTKLLHDNQTMSCSHGQFILSQLLSLGVVSYWVSTCPWGGSKSWDKVGL